MKEKLFAINNPNADIFIIPNEEGVTDDDQTCAMIGDAVARHVQSLSLAERQCWEHFICLGNQNIFETEPSTEYNDKDPFNLDTEDLDNYFKNYRLLEKDKAVLQEAIEEEKKRREESEDLYDNKRDVMISYQDWQENPVAAKYLNIAPTPKDRVKYCGAIDIPFYDYIDQGHPDSQKIINFINYINRDIDELTPPFVKNIKFNLFFKAGIKSQYVKETLSSALDKIIDGKDPDTTIINALEDIDNSWRKYYHQASKQKLLNDNIYQLLLFKYQDWEAKHKQGVNVYPQIKQFGILLFRKFKKQLKPIHWKFYKRIKLKFAPKVYINKLDINKCNIRQICENFKISKQKAVLIIDNRPYGSVEEFNNKKLI